MTRPNIVRADTLDLQTPNSPSAQDHSQSLHPAPLGIGPAAPHQEASLRRVEDERNVEERRLQNGPMSNGSTTRNEPDSDDERTIMENHQGADNAAIRSNGGSTRGVEGNGTTDADAEAEDMDDMDRISSSPSISDGKSHPIESSPISFSLSSTNDPSPQSMDRNGKYIEPRIFNAGEAIINQDYRISPVDSHPATALQNFQTGTKDSEALLYSESSDNNTEGMLKPITNPAICVLEDPFVDRQGGTTQISLRPAQVAIDSHQSEMSFPTPSHPGCSEETDSGDDEDWTTDSDADSWDGSAGPDDADDSCFSDDPRFVDSGWGGECLRDTEDIDFEFVYALHTFVATVEGQANATKGDTMVLLDDSNSYWWLVRVVKDSSIGYLPAEHIETPTERLARLNKHRNIDLSATMLGDTADRPKNPLKKAMRRRNAKTVQFAPPTYVEASDYDYSSDEGEDGMFGGPDPNQIQAQQQQQAAATNGAEYEQDESLKPQPLKQVDSKIDQTNNIEAEGRKTLEEPSKKGTEDSRSSNDVLDEHMDPKITRNGTLRNTDSFFRDENTETRKINLTPSLLRDDSSTSTTGSRERAASLESLEKTGSTDKVKDDKRKKEKKSGMLSGLFKRKDKKPRSVGDAIDGETAFLDEPGRNSPQTKVSDEASTERALAEQAPGPQRLSSKGKLQKPRSRGESPSKVKGVLKTESPEPIIPESTTLESSDEATVNQPASTMRLVSPERGDPNLQRSERALSPDNSTSRSRSSSSASKLNPMNLLRHQQPEEPKPEQVKQAKQRVQLDDFDSEDEKEDPFADPEAQTHPSNNQISEPNGRLSESPVHVSAVDAQLLRKDDSHAREPELDSQQPPGLLGDTSSQETTSPVSTPTPEEDPSTSLNPTIPPTVHHSPAASIPPPSRPAPVPEKHRQREISPPQQQLQLQTQQASPSQKSSISSTLPAWSDASLRSYLDDGSDIRDMMLVINDTTGLVPATRDHPLMTHLFAQETETVSGLSSELDALLVGLLDKRMKKGGSRFGLGASPTAASGRSTPSTAIKVGR